MKQLALLIFAGLLGSEVYAQPYLGIYAPPPPPVPRYAYGRPPIPGPGYYWVDGYWDYARPAYRWNNGYWARPPYRGGYWVAPRHNNGRYYKGYWGNRNFVQRRHR